MWEILEENLPSGGSILLSGVNHLALDTKGRLAIPTRYRAGLEACCASQLVVTIDPTRCLLIYPHNDWKQVEERLMGLPSLNPAARNLQRLLVGHAQHVEMDRQGRILISPPLREFAGLESQVVLMGQMNKFELWNEAQWYEQRERWLVESDFGALGDSPDFKNLTF
jgi:MraZ protein